MQKFFAVALILGAANIGWGSEPIFVPPPTGARVEQTAQYAPQPTPAPELSPAQSSPYVSPEPVPDSSVQPGVILGSAPQLPAIPLYPVKVRQARNIAPCAVEKIVSVPDPCNPCCCVFVSICVPPCACEKVVCHPNRDSVRFDYGKYAVNVTSHRGKLIVNYDD